MKAYALASVLGLLFVVQGAIFAHAIPSYLALEFGNTGTDDDNLPANAKGTNATSCICTLEYNPVCGVDGKTYGNACQAKCAGVKVDHLGACKSKGCICYELYAPVCGKDGKTYGNACFAKCAKVDVDYKGVCVKGVECPKGVQPSECLRDPCDKNRPPCDAHPNAHCVSNYCPGISLYMGEFVWGPCTAIYTDPVTGDIVDCMEDYSDS